MVTRAAPHNGLHPAANQFGCRRELVAGAVVLAAGDAGRQMDNVMLLRSIQQGDAADWERMRQQLWPSPAGEHAAEIELFFRGDRRNPSEVLIAVDESGRAVGFAELSIRPYAEGCDSGRVAYLEGWFVEGPHRRKGVGGALVKEAEGWARAQGCTEFASDTEVGNAASAAAHERLGFEEVDRIICFRKAL